MRKGQIAWFYHARGGVVVGRSEERIRMPEPYGVYFKICGLSAPKAAVHPIDTVPRDVPVVAMDEHAARHLGVDFDSYPRFVHTYACINKMVEVPS